MKNFFFDFLRVDRLIVASHGGFLDGFRQGGVSVASAANILRTSAVLHCKAGFGNQLASLVVDDVDTENLIGGGIDDDLDETSGALDGLGAGVGHEVELADLVLDAGGLDLVLCLADPGDLGGGVDDAGNDVVVDVAVLAGELLRDGDTFVLGLVGEHGALVDDVADGVDAVNVGLPVVVDFDEAALVHLDADLVEAEVGGVGLAADGDEADVGVEGLLLAALGGFDGE